MNRSLFLTASLVLLPLCGCTAIRKPLEPVHNPVDALQEVMLIPVGAENADSSQQWTRQLQQALLKVEGIQRVQSLPPSAADNPTALLRSANRCLLEVNVLDFDAYYPPYAVVEVNFYVPPQAHSAAWDPLQMERMGRAKGSVQQSDRGPWLRFQKRYGADDMKVMQALTRYAMSSGDDSRGLDPVDRVIQISDRFVDFVFYETLKECFSRLDRKEEESNGFLGELLNGGS